MQEDRHSFKIVSKVNDLLGRLGIEGKQFARELNAFLPYSMRKNVTKSRLVVVYRWLDLHHKNWMPPRGDALIAMQKWIKSKQRA